LKTAYELGVQVFIFVDAQQWHEGWISLSEFERTPQPAPELVPISDDDVPF
jgi:hypothetical protein